MCLRLVAAVCVVGLSAAGAVAQPAGGFKALTFKSADGVKLAGRFYKAKGDATSTILMVPAYGQTMKEKKWTETAAYLVNKNFNVFTFDHRGHGESIDIVPTEFWVNGANRSLVSAPSNPANKTTISANRDFKNGYYPMLVQDLAAARNALDLMNDAGEVNTSTVYLLGVGDAAGLGLFFLSTEWSRERQRPNLPIPAQFVSPARGLFVGSEPAGLDYGGAIWISPARNNAIPARGLKNVVLSPAATNMRTETPMLFISGSKDSRSMTAARSFITDTLATKLPGGTGPKPKGDQTIFLVPIDKADAASASGLGLLGTNSGAEDKIVEFLETKERERKSRPRKNRDWDKPLIIDVAAFGLGR